MSPPFKPTTSIDDLPPEMISELFEHLQLKDLIACSLVNKRWHSIFAAFKLHRLAATDFDIDEDYRKWHGSNQSVQERCDPAMFRRLAEKPLLSNLKHLALCGDDLEFDLNKLNRFSWLVHLEINCPLGEKEVHLNLPRLKVLVFQCWNYSCHLSIDCPLLSTLVYAGEREDANLLKVKQPETIRELETDMVVEKLAPFKNVERLTRKLEAISKATLLSLPRLRELRQDVYIESAFWREARNGAGAVDRMKRTLSEFLDEAKKLRGSDFRFSFSGFLLSKVDVNQIDFGVRTDESGAERVCNEYVYMKNYHLIERGALPFVERVHYIRLLRDMTGEFPDCFFQKFTGIKEVSTSEIPNVDQFLRFLKPLRFLRSLYLETRGLSQEFYDQLPASTHSLSCLVLSDQTWESELQLNFDFIGRLPCISELVIQPFVSLKSLPSLVRWLGRLRDVGDGVGVRMREKDYWIENYSKEWKVQNENSEVLFKTKNPEELMNFFESFQDDIPEELVNFFGGPQDDSPEPASDYFPLSFD